jgi:hypothetical protein
LLACGVYKSGKAMSLAAHLHGCPNRDSVTVQGVIRSEFQNRQTPCPMESQEPFNRLMRHGCVVVNEQRPEMLVKALEVLIIEMRHSTKHNFMHAQNRISPCHRGPRSLVGFRLTKVQSRPCKRIVRIALCEICVRHGFNGQHSEANALSIAGITGKELFTEKLEHLVEKTILRGFHELVDGCCGEESYRLVWNWTIEVCLRK